MNPIVSNGNKLRWKFENIKDLTDDGLYSEKFTFETIDCVFIVSKKIKVRTTTRNNVKYLSYYVHYDCENRKDKNWICETMRTVRLLNQVENGKDISRTASNRLYDAIEYTWGFPKFVCWSNVLSDGYLKDDSIIVEVDLSFKYYDFSKNIPNYTDISINVEDTQFLVNKGMLCSRSQYFYVLFVNKMSEETTIKIENVKIKDFRYFIASFYPLFKTVEMDNYQKLIELAAQYLVPTLHENCEKFLISKTNIELTEKLKYADQHGYHGLMKTCLDSLKSAQQIDLLHKSVEFHNFKATTKLCIMARLLNFL